MTTINSSMAFDQTYIDTYPGPYTVEGGTEQNPIIITIGTADPFSPFSGGGSITITSIDTYFIINSDYVTITNNKGFFSNNSVITINNVLLYSGLVHNLKKFWRNCWKR